MTHKTLVWALAAAISAVGAGGPLMAPARAQQRLPLFFVPTLGQTEPGASFTLRSTQLSAQFTTAETRFEFDGARLTVRFAGASPQVRLEAADQLPGRVNYLLGDRRDQWQTDVPTYATILYHDLYPGIDLTYSVDQGRLKSEFRVSPGADPGAIRWQYQGGQAPRIAGGGGLVVAVGGGELREQPPVMYQEEDGRRVPVQGAFRILDNGLTGFTTGAFDRRRPLVIDPVLSYSTYLGGAGMDNARAIAVDSAGNAYVAGFTDSSGFPTANPLQSRTGGGVDAFVAKLNAAGSALVYCTYLGGSWDDRAFGIAVDAGGSAYLTGWTYSPNFPTTSGTLQRKLGGGRDAFAAKLNAAGNMLVYSTYLGGNGHDSGNGIAIDSAGNSYVAGDTYSGNFPVLYAFQGSSNGRQDAFLAKLNAAGTGLVWGSYLGGYGDESASAVALDASANAYVTGGTTSTNFPTHLPLQSSNAGGQDVFVTKFYADGQTLAFSTYLGGSGGTVGANEMGTAIQVDAAAGVYVAGITSSANFPVANAVEPVRGGGMLDGFVAKLGSTGNTLVYSTYLGGAGVDYIYGLAVAPSRAAAVAGYTSSSNFPLADAVQTTKSGAYEGFVARLSPSGGALEIGTYLGGSGSDAINSVATDRAGNLWVAGQTMSLNFPLKNAFQSLNAGGYSAFVAKIADNVPVAGFRASDGSVRLFSYANNIMRSAGGYVTSDVGTAQLRSGDTYVVARTPANEVWLNLFQNDTQSWKGWVYGGTPLYGNPAVAAMADGGAYVVTRKSDNSCWIQHYLPGTGFRGWISLGGAFASDPSAAAAADGTVHIAATDAAGVVWIGRYAAGSGFLGWVSGGSPGSVLATGRPAITVGSDQAAYVATRASDNTLWVARVQGGVWGAWSAGASSLQTDPSLAAGAGLIYVLVNSSTGPLAVRPLAEGAGGEWQSPISTGGFVQDGAIAAVHGRFFIAGRDWDGAVWWYESGGAVWTHYGYKGWVAGNLTAAPR